MIAAPVSREQGNFTTEAQRAQRPEMDLGLGSGWWWAPWKLGTRARSAENNATGFGAPVSFRRSFLAESHHPSYERLACSLSLRPLSLPCCSATRVVFQRRKVNHYCRGLLLNGWKR